MGSPAIPKMSAKRFMRPSFIAHVHSAGDLGTAENGDVLVVGEPVKQRASLVRVAE